MLHAVEDSKTGNDGTSRTVDVKVNWLIGVLGIKIKHNSDDLVGEFIVNFGSEEDDTFAV